MLGTEGVPGDDTMGGGTLVFRVGRCVRLTRSHDKGNGCANGALGVIKQVAHTDVCVCCAHSAASASSPTP